MGLSNYSVSLILKSNEPLEGTEDFGIFSNVLTLQDSDDFFFIFQLNLDTFSISEKQFNNKFSSRYGEI